MALTKITDDPAQIRLYHITHIDNLASIISSRALLSLHQMEQAGIQPRSIAYSHLQERRDAITIPIAPGGDLHDYVPWSFAARSPMLYTAWRGALGNDVRQSDIVHLVSDVRKVRELQLPFIFTDGHPLSSELTTFFDRIDALPSTLDWDVLCAHVWRNTEEDADRKRRRQAEFLIHGAVPWSLVKGIAVQSESMRDRAASLLGMSTHQPKVALLPEWYY